MCVSYIRELEKILKNNMEKRGLKKAFIEGDLKKAADSLINGDTVFIATGFTIKEVGAGETDGPIGAASLAGVLEEMGKKVVLITDVYSENILKKVVGIRGIKSVVKVVNGEINKWYAQELLNIYKPSHIIAVERPGKASDGKCYSMGGEDLGQMAPAMDQLFEEAKKEGIKTIAIGDGGNEIGMGKIRHQVLDLVPNGELICASFASDFLILAGVSNWGAHALSAALSLLVKRDLLHDINTEIAMLKGLVEAGAVDGCTKKKTMTVDGISLHENLKIFMAIKGTLLRGVRHVNSVRAQAKI